MGALDSLAAALSVLILMSDPLQGFLGFVINDRHSTVISSLDEGMVVLVMLMLGLKAFRGVRIPRHFLLWVPFLLLFLVSWTANQSSPVLAANLAFAFLKPFILAVAAANFLAAESLPRIYFVFKWATLLQVPFLAYQISKFGYVTGTLADQYTGAIHDAHAVAALALVPSLWNLGAAYAVMRATGKVSPTYIAAGLFFFFFTILCEAKFLYMGAVLGIIALLVFTERTRIIPMLPRLALVLGPMAAFIFYFGWEYFASMGYDKMFEIFQKMEAYYTTFFELPDKIPFPALGAGPGTYGSAIAQKSLPPLADYFFGNIMRDVTVGGTFMTPFSEINGAFGEFGYLGPFLLLLPYLGHLSICISRLRETREPIIAGALFASIVLLFIILLETVFLPSLVQSQMTFPAFFLSTLALLAPRDRQRDPAAATLAMGDRSP